MKTRSFNNDYSICIRQSRALGNDVDFEFCYVVKSCYDR